MLVECREPKKVTKRSTTKEDESAMQDLHNVFQHFRLGKGNVHMLNDLVPRKICSGMKSIYPLAVANLSQTYHTFGLLAGQTPLPIVDAVVQTSDGWHRSIGRTWWGSALGQAPVGGWCTRPDSSCWRCTRPGSHWWAPLPGSA